MFGDLETPPPALQQQHCLYRCTLYFCISTVVARVPPGSDVPTGICVYHEFGLHRVVFCDDEALYAASVAAPDASEAFGGAGVKAYSAFVIWLYLNTIDTIFDRSTNFSMSSVLIFIHATYIPAAMLAGARGWTATQT